MTRYEAEIERSRMRADQRRAMDAARERARETAESLLQQHLAERG